MVSGERRSKTRNLSGTRLKSACYKSSSCRFSFSAPRNFITKATEFVTFVFLSVFWFSSPSRKAWTPLSESDTDFSVFLAAIIRKKSDKRPWIENGEVFAVHSYTWPNGAKGGWRVSSWLAVSYTREKIRYLFRYVVTAFLRAGNPCMTP